MIMKKNKSKIVLSLLLVLSMVLLAACGKSNENKGEQQKEEGKILNIGYTDSLSSVNPLLMDATEALKYALALEFLPLVELNSNLEFEGALASSITTDDNLNFIVEINKDAKWSDGTPVTGEDLEFTVLKLASPKLGNASMALYHIEGVEDSGFVAEGATEISGVKVIDEKKVQFTTKYPMALTTFENTFGRYILTLPKHILKDITEDQLASYEWFQAPTVVSGPYVIKSYDLQHFVSYEANKDYWQGAPKIDKLNIRITTAAQLLTGLRSGEIDFVQQTTGNILQEDYQAVEELGNVTVNYGAPVTNQSIFINSKQVDVRIRRAILHGIDRQTLIDGFLNGKGEIVDGFLSSASPFYSEELVPTAYDVEKAKALVAEAVADGWDASRVLNFYVNSGDSTFTQAADYIVAKLAEIGIKIQVYTVDISTLLDKAGKQEFDLLAVQYTYAPVDPYPDVAWLMTEDSWTAYGNDKVGEALAATQIAESIEDIRAEYLKINKIVQEDAPMISAYIISGMGAVNKRVSNAVPDVYGSFINIHEWDVTQ